MRVTILLLLIAGATTGCAMVTVQTSTGGGGVSHDADKGAIIIKRPPEREQTP